MVAFGGAGGLFAAEVADFLGIATAVVPPNPGNLSAFGLHVSDVKRDYVRTCVRQQSSHDPGELETLWSALEDAGRDEIAAEGVARGAINLGPQRRRPLCRRGARGSGPDPARHRRDRCGGNDVARLSPGAREHLRLPLRGPPGCRGRQPQGPGGGPRAPAGDPPSRVRRRRGRPRRESRRVYWRGSGWIECGIWRRGDLGVGAALAGPAIVEEYGSTTVVPESWQLTVDGYGNLILEKSS